HILHHSWKNWERKLNNETIDKSKNKLNYQIFNSVRSGEPLKAEHIQQVKDLIKEETGRAVRKDAVVVASIVVTRPPNVSKNDEMKFFEQSYNFFRERLLEAKLDLSNSHLTGFVHMNETTPHMHLQFIPIQKCDKGHKLNAKNIVSRSLLQTMHKDLTEHLEKELHYRPELLIDEEHSIDRMLGRYDLDNKDYQKIKNALTQDLRREKEYLRQDIRREEQAIAEVDNSIKIAKIQSSPKEATKEIGRIQGLIRELKERAERIRGFVVGVLAERSQSTYRRSKENYTRDSFEDRVRTASTRRNLNSPVKEHNYGSGYER
nr:plasmid recombination protein [Enterococcus sp.]